MIEIGIEKVGDGAHWIANNAIDILALKLCHFISMGFGDIGLDFFVHS